MEGAVEHIVNVNGISLFVQIIGHGEPLLLLMGLGAPGDKWEPNVAAYKDSFECICIDNRGAGRSDKPEESAYTVRQMAEESVAVLDKLGYGSVHINGISMGGAIAQEIAINYPDRVRSLILTSTFCTVTETFKNAISILRDQKDVMEPAALKRLNQWMTFAPKTQNTRPELLKQMAAEDASYPYPMPSYAYKAQCNACLSHEAADRLCRIKAPTLIAAGDNDRFAVPSVSEMMHELIPDNVLYMCKDGGHVHEWEHLEEYNKVTKEFLLAHSGRG